ncbi:MAG: hypothetical protein ABR520_11145 [Mycobacteriales bacterium]|nr:hypothetical protein [Actinomycetota bacterium]
MDWSNERFVRLYTRDTPEWLCWSWQARALWPHLIRKADRSGVIANKLGARGLAALVGLPVDLVEAALPDLVADGCLQDHQLGYVIPNYIEAQETPQSDKQRQRESRERRRVVTNRDSESRIVTERHAVSRDVTPIRSDPIRSEDLPPARDPAVPALAPAPAQPLLPGPLVTTPAEIARAQPASREVGKPATTGEPTLDQLWSELEQARQRAAVARGVAIRPLVAHDRGRRDLAEALVEAARVGERAKLVADVRHAIAAAEAESRVAPEPGKPDRLQWFTGAVFSPDNFRRLAGTPLAKRSADAGAKRRREVATQPASADRKRTAAELAELSAMANHVAALPTAELVKRFGSPDGARAPPASAAPTDPDDEPRRKAAT